MTASFVNTILEPMTDLMADSIPVLNKVLEQIKPMADTDFLGDDWYIDGEIIIKNAQGYSIGRFVPEDEWWVFKVEYKET